MQKILVSACLLGQKVRYDGGDKQQFHAVLERWLDAGRVVPFCPEVAGGLPIPRAAAEIERGDAAAILAGQGRVLTGSGGDVTLEFLQGAAKAVALCRQDGIRLAVMTEGSPSCGSSRVYVGQFSGATVPGPGVTVLMLRQAGIRVFSQLEFEAADAALQELADD